MPVLEQLAKASRLDELSANERWRKHKLIIREASVITARRCLAKVMQTNEEKLQVLMQAARAVCFDQPHIIQKIILSMPCLKDIVGIDKYGHASIKDPALFQTVTSSVLTLTL